MAGKRRRRSRSYRRMRFCLSAIAIAMVLLIGVTGARYMESRMRVKVENAGMQMTAHAKDENTAQVFMNNQWYQKKEVETLLVMGIDDYDAITGENAYTSIDQADFLVLFIRDKETGENKAIHINRDVMTDITMLGLTGETAGVQRAQLALAFNYGQGRHENSRNTVNAVSNLLYGTKIDNYLTVTMGAVPVINDWAGGVTVEVLDDMTSVDTALVLGKEIKLDGQQALSYVRARKTLEDSTNINRMERQRQYAAAWVNQAQQKLGDADAVTNLVMQMSDYHVSDCSAEKLAEFANTLSKDTSVETFELPGVSVRGEQFMEFYADDEGIQKLLLDLFYDPVV